MRRFSNLRHCRRQVIRRTLSIAAVAAALPLVTPAARAGDEQLAKAGAANRPLLIREHAAWNMDCRAVPYPVLRLDQPPRHGAVCARVTDVTIKHMYAGTEAQCIGHIVQGLRLIYFPNPGYTGSDRLRYSVQYRSGQRSVSASVSAGEGVLQADTVGAGPDTAQVPGPVPPCATPVS